MFILTKIKVKTFHWKIFACSPTKVALSDCLKCPSHSLCSHPPHSEPLDAPVSTANPVASVHQPILTVSDEHPPLAKKRRTMSTSEYPVKPLPAPEKNPSNRYSELSIESFLESEIEAAERSHLEEKLMSYFTLKKLNSSGHPLKRVREFMSSDHDVNRSRVYYMDLIDEYTDSDETLMSIAEQLLKEFRDKQEDTILVRDGKTYQRLMKIKKM